MATKKEIAGSLVKFIANDLMPDSCDKHQKFALSMAKEALACNPDVIDGFLESPVVANVLKESEGDYDIDSFCRTLRNTLSSYESFPVVIPAIPVFAPRETTVKIVASDVDKILSYLRNGDEET